MDVKTPPHGGHEASDVNVRSVSRFTIGLTLVTIFVLGLMWLVMDFFLGREAARSPKPAPMIAADPLKEPPEPRLQTKPALDLQKVREDEEALLHQYGWVDPDKGIVRIPVERAMELVAKEGLPVRPGGGK
ncbi:MAG: hypothetical protein HYR60_13020 [Acidobacteria bacterium]|nr:hypothetical protein [Acidobacteriota bacterium]MBI3472262.1 hypothetical protein [Candidatus Solibacter usitatus]